MDEPEVRQVAARGLSGRTRGSTGSDGGERCRGAVRMGEDVWMVGVEDVWMVGVEDGWMVGVEDVWMEGAEEVWMEGRDRIGE